VTSVAILAGGRSFEREVSLRSGHRVSTALRARGFDVDMIDPSEPDFVARLCAARTSACYVALHGRDGEDGTVQRILEALEIPYTGSRPSACRAASDKIAMKEALDAADVPTPAWGAVQASALRDLAAGPTIPRIVERVGLPLLVKPATGGSAMGITPVDRDDDVARAVMNALAFSDAAVLERRIDGVEVAAGLLEGIGNALPLVEVVPRSGVFDFAARYTLGATEYFAPARLADEGAAAATDVAARAFATLGVRDIARADVMVAADGTAYVIDVNVSPGMTESSLVPMAAQAVGISFEDLCERVIRRALDRRWMLTP
jgi:D-alanine-D-alanine ligase